MCIPNVGKTKEEILSLTEQYRSMSMDLMEWRVDWFEGVEDTQAVLDVLSGVREKLGDTPLLFTFRTKKEGGVHEMDTTAYVSLNKAVAATKLADLIDVEIFTGDGVVSDLISAIHASGTKVVASNHDFDKTPAKSDILYRLRKMQDMGADIPKDRRHAQEQKGCTDSPLRHGGDGLRLCGPPHHHHVHGRPWQHQPSLLRGLRLLPHLRLRLHGLRPGQIGAGELRQILTSVHNALGE